jgi:chemotaxis protein MotB
MADTPTPGPAPVIVIVKKKSLHGGHHGGAWKVAYADFVTAMMALFIVLWILNQSQEVREAVSGYFKDPLGYGKMTGTTKEGSGKTVEVTRTNMSEIKKKLEEAMKRVPELEKLKDQVQMTVTNEGLRIELLETEKGMFFESGRPMPTSFGKELLELLAKEIGKLPNHLLIEGHTDARPYVSENGYSNWELSADRANAARRIMQVTGIRADQITEVRGYAAQKLRKPDAPDDASNRRISVTVKYLDGQGSTESTPDGNAVQSPKSDDAHPAAAAAHGAPSVRTGPSMNSAAAQKAH